MSSPVWMALGTVWLFLLPPVARLTGEGGDRRAVVEVRMQCPNPGPGAVSRPRVGDRLTGPSRAFAVLSVVEADGRGDWLELLTEEVAP